MNSPEQENLYARWSRRKQLSAEEVQAEDRQVELKQSLDGNEVSATVSINEIEFEQASETPLLTDADMPSIDSLNEESDFSMFMSSGVSDELRNLALRKMFMAPVFNLRDGLDEYDEDYTSFEKLGDIVTCDMKHQLEIEAKKKLEQEAASITEIDSEKEQLEAQQAEPEHYDRCELVLEDTCTAPTTHDQIHLDTTPYNMVPDNE